MTPIERLHALLRLTEQIGQARTSDEMYEAALDCVEGALGVTRSSILLFDDDGVMRFKAWRGISDTYRAAVEGHTPWSRGERVDAPVLVSDTHAAPELDGLRPTFEREGIRGLVFVPLRIDGGVIGKFMLYHAEPAELDVESARQMLVVADQIALAVTRRDSEGRLRAANDLLDSLLENLREGIIFTDGERRVRYINGAARRLMGLPMDVPMVGRRTNKMPSQVTRHFEQRDEFLAKLEEALAARTPVEDIELRLKDGRVFVLGYTPVVSMGRFEGHLWQIGELTERRRLEAELTHAQRLESVGRLAGGVAHDFNNLLTAIQGYVELARHEIPADAAAVSHLNEALVAAQQANALTRRLLTFARRQPVQPKPIDLCGMLVRMEPMLRQLVREDIEIDFERCATSGWVRADEGQMEQVFVNLVLNARDAMPQGGRLSVSTNACEIEVLLRVTDTGIGMDEGTLRRVFEPFFTTKEMGGGTGLGLSSVHGIVEGCCGRVEVASRRNEGSTFSVFLPRIAAPSRTVPAKPAGLEAASPSGQGLVLLIEDDVRVRELATLMLQRLGYEVLAADGPQRALELSDDAVGEVDIILSDIVMPGMDGRALAEELKIKQPQASVVLMSGYAPPSHLELKAMRFLAKPFGGEALASAIADACAARHAKSTEKAPAR